MTSKVDRLLFLHGVHLGDGFDSDEEEQEFQSLKQQIEQALEKEVFILCKAKECFPEHEFIVKDRIHYCKELEIGEVNWD